MTNIFYVTCISRTQPVRASQVQWLSWCYLHVLVFLGDFKCICDTFVILVPVVLYWAMKMGEEASKHKVTTDKQRNWSLIITSTSVWEADAASCHAVDSIAKCHNSEYESGANCMCVCLVLHCHNLQLPLCARCSVRLPSLTILGPVVYCFLYCDAMQPVTLQMGTTGFRMLILIYHVLTRCHSCVSAMYLT